MYITAKSAAPAIASMICEEHGPDGRGTCTLPQFHSGVHIAHGLDGNHFTILAFWDGDRTTDEQAAS